jgi:hypothetical protein
MLQFILCNFDTFEGAKLDIFFLNYEKLTINLY